MVKTFCLGWYTVFIQGFSPQSIFMKQKLKYANTYVWFHNKITSHKIITGKTFSVYSNLGQGCKHMKILTFGISLHKMEHPIDGYTVGQFFLIPRK